MFAIITFSLCASAVYVINDLTDLAADRRHEEKRRRPFAAGTLSVAQGIAMGTVLLAVSIGLSGLLSFQSAYNRLLAECPDVLPRLYRGFWFDRQHEHAPGDARLAFNPLFEPAAEGVHVRFSRRLVSFGYTLSGEEMDGSTRAAFDALCAVIERPELERAFAFQRGQIQIVNNRRIGHRRAAYEDWPQPDRKRHMVRIWIRHKGRPGYSG